MKRYVSIWFPYLQTDWLTIHNPYLKEQIFVFTTLEYGKTVITAANKAAEKQGILPGTPLADARAIVPEIQVFDEIPGLNAKILTKLAKWCIRYTPVAAIDSPDGLFLDSSGCVHLWGGEKQYLQTLLNRLQEAGYECYGAIADTIGTAWALSRYCPDPIIVPENQQYQALLSLPPAALRLENSTIQRLLKLGFVKINTFIKMPRTVLRRRFGEAFLQRLEQALGTKAEVLQPIAVLPPYHERLPLLEPIRTHSAIEVAIHSLVTTLCQRLVHEGLGIRQAILKGYRIDGKITQVQIGTNKATHAIKHICNLFALKISSIAPDLGIELFTLTATRTESVTVHQGALWTTEKGLENLDIVELLDRIAGKVGAHTIKRYLPNAQFWPEYALKPATFLNEKSAINWLMENPRPITLLPKPVPIVVTAPVPDYPPMNFYYQEILHKIIRADGPERIERPWWLESGAHRDYYTVEDEQGQRYWLFRSGHYTDIDSKWFIHGFFA